MNNPLKIGIISGLIAGIIAGIIGAISTIVVMKAGLPYIYLSIPVERFVTKIFGIEIILSIIFGIILGIIFLKAYNVIPGERVTKYIVYGLFCHLIVGIRETTFGIPYSIGMPLALLLEYASWIIIGFPQWIAYALVLGFLYEFLRKKKYIIMEKKKTIKYDIMGGAILGAFLGIINGIVAWIVILLYEDLINFSFVPAEIIDMVTIIYRLMAHTFIHIIWGMIFGAIFVLAYNIVPGKGIMKGLFYAYIIYLISTVHQAALYLAYGFVQPLGALIPGLNVETKELILVLGGYWIFVDIFVYGIYGLLLGYLYKPPK